MSIKKDQITLKLISAINDVLNNEENENHIKLTEENATDFFHALANEMPTYAYSQITNTEINCLEFNHIANQMCFQYMKKEEEDGDKK